jgi:integrase
VEAVARAAENDQDAALFRVAAYTGLRLGELRALRWSDIDFGLRLVHVRRSFTYGALDTPKSGRVRSVPLIDQVARALDGLSRRERFTDDDHLVFPGVMGSFFDDSATRRRFKSALATAHVKPMRFHDLRQCLALRRCRCSRSRM